MRVSPDADEADRLARQRSARRDLTLAEQPALARLTAWHTRLLVAHLWFCGALLVLGYAYPAGARALAWLAYPLARIAAVADPAYRHMYRMDEPFGQDFYVNVGGEAWCMTLALALIYLAIYAGRYWRFPWRLGEFMLEQQGLRRHASQALLGALAWGALAGLLGMALAVWLGIAAPGSSMGGALALHQLVLWCILMPSAGFAFVLTALLALSSLLFALRHLPWRRTPRA